MVLEAVLEAMWLQARREAPRECVGLLVGRAGRAEAAWPLPNVSPRPEVAYEADPRALVAALRRMDEAGLELVGIYHSHPNGVAWPSPTDRERAYWRVPYVILGLAEGAVRAFMLPEGEEVALLVDA